MDTPPSSAELDDLRLTMINNYASTAFLMLLLWDIIITLGDEIEYIWLQPGQRLGKWLFFLNRYVPPIDLIILINTYTNRNLDRDMCANLAMTSDNWLSVLSLAVVDLILLLRTYALWNRSRKVLYFLIGVFTLCTLATSGAVVYFTLSVFPTPIPAEIRPCSNAFREINVVEAVWGSTILFDSSVVILTIAKLIPYFQEKVTTDLFRIMYQDGFMYFGILFCISVSNLFVFALAPNALKLTLVTLQRAMFSLLASRLALNLRGVLTRRTLIDGTTGAFGDEAELSTMRIAPGTVTISARSANTHRLDIDPFRRRPSTLSPSSPKRPVLDSFGYPSPEDEFAYGGSKSAVDTDDSPADDSPQTPWTTPWGNFRIDDNDGEKKPDLDVGAEGAAADVQYPPPQDVRIAGEDDDPIQIRVSRRPSLDPDVERGIPP